MKRTDELAAAALRIVTRDGLAAVTFRAVASESGWSLGAVQKTFRSKSELIGATLTYAQSRVSDAVSVEPGRPSLRDWLVNLVIATLPLDDDRRSACLIGVAFSDRAPFDSDIAESIRAWDQELRHKLGMLAGRAHAEGELDRRIDGDQLARAVLAFASGLASQLLYDPIDEEAARSLVTSIIWSLTAVPESD
ncbi:TetR/AcrR family transcriptional regulator [Salinibacterium sp. NK8237]|uniref:TetR/AcrR family transcriptional regulator n=1 Tax=Salinibacterium sp. NK8237 TaxID=2792038 RepID=UPI0018CD3BE7|nr:TetR family transcriptional regulator C-terminal domain-containing protein [Salinibacterium sp. NK8237]MBH0130798.1 TetR/AcrR family transcriptional regulator [Salinibacterium sp. NK8237]